jgi:hypothetical protein
MLKRRLGWLAGAAVLLAAAIRVATWGSSEATGPSRAPSAPLSSEGSAREPVGSASVGEGIDAPSSTATSEGQSQETLQPNPEAVLEQVDERIRKANERAAATRREREARIEALREQETPTLKLNPDKRPVEKK